MIIFVQGNISFFLCGHFLPENLAFQKPTYQHSYAVSGGTSDKAVDGNIYYYGILSGTVSSITDTSMTSPKCGRAATHNLPPGVGLSFFCHPSLKGRYVTIRDVRRGESGFNLCEVEVYSEQRGMAYLDILKNYS